MSKVVDQDYPGESRLSDEEIKNKVISQAAPVAKKQLKN